MAGKPHIAVAVVLVLLSSSLAACGPKTSATLETPAPEGPPPAAEDILARIEAAVVEVSSYRFSAFHFSNLNVDMRSFRVSGAWAAPGNFEMRQEGMDRGKGLLHEFVMVDGVALSRSTGGQPGWLDGRWQELPHMAGRDPSMLHNLPIQGEDVTVEPGTLEGRPTYVVTSQRTASVPQSFAEEWPEYRPPVTTDTVHVDRETYLPLQVTGYTSGITTGPMPRGAQAHGTGPTPVVADGWSQITYDFFDFNGLVTIRLPEDWRPSPRPTPTPEPTVPAATLMYQLDREVDDDSGWNELHRVLSTRLLVRRLAGRSLTLTGGRELTVSLPPGTMPVEQVDALLRAPGRLEVFERVCATARCERPGEDEDKPTGITHANVVRAEFTMMSPGTQYGVTVQMDEEAAQALAVLTERLTQTNASDSPDQLAMYLDGELLLAASVRGRITSGGVQIVQDFTEGEARDLAAVLTSGPLPVGLSLLRMEVRE